MAWPVTPDPDRFDEALRFFASRIVMTGDFAVALDAKARSEAFWIGVGLQIHEVQSVFNEVQKAIDAGESFDDFRKRVGDILTDKAHAETVFRNATQRSYNAGRWAQMRDPDVLAARPYWMFDAILDSATTATCKDANGTILDADDPWWSRNLPPRHHRCRSSVRNIRERDARRRGISDSGPTEADEGFGAAPSDDDVELLKPDPRRVDPVIIDLTRKKANDTRKPPPKPKKKAKAGPAKKPRKKPAKVARKNLGTPQEHYDPDYWTEQYRAQYGEAAPCVGWGRAMYERALDRPVGELAEQARKLASEGHPIFSASTGAFRASSMEFVEGQLGKEATLRQTMLIAVDSNGWVSALSQLEHSKTIRRSAFPIAAVNEEARGAKAFYESMLDASVSRPSGYTLHVGTRVYPSGIVEELKRSHCDDFEKVIAIKQGAKTSIHVHEWAHAIEATDSRALNRSFEFYESRTKRETDVSLSKLLPGRGYRDDEFCKPDEFWSPYQGKVYYVADKRRNTEMTPMGYQAMSEPSEIHNQDPETTYFMLGQLAGR